ncbi:hypothetical protein FJQ98_21720 [Lysinibacillus agricola]|uniref:Uncharacterized protein n=1 Tax=Lysinibacillus agricola TaxID=2590012 RepID=A0ABX7APA0_9BACI|nr:MULTISPECIES: hypothetical protein [Lysinibacillus]QQP11773.1 hypothetical protein FJQ98_21720 [Lysinibacillus agricola]
MSRLGQHLCAKAKRQRQMFSVRQPQNVGHEVIITGRDAFSLRLPGSL